MTEGGGHELRTPADGLTAGAHVMASPWWAHPGMMGEPYAQDIKKQGE
ncbi:hypothetical protein ACNYS0_39250 [Streptomyces sp. BH034]